MGKHTKAAVEAERARRQRVRARPFTPENIADGHPFQLAVLLSVGDLLIQCSRRAGKTWCLLGLLGLTALATPNVTCLYLGLNGVAAEEQWLVWLRMTQMFALEGTPKDRVWTFPNGSRIIFDGLDDKRHCNTFRGMNLSAGLCVIDEAQSDPGLLDYVLVEVLLPMIDEQIKGHLAPGRVVVAGSIPEIEGAGAFDRLWLENTLPDQKTTKPDAAYTCFNWSRFENPHETNNEELLKKHLKKTGRSIEDPVIQRNWFGRRVFSSDVTAYGYNIARNRWTGAPAPWSNVDLKPGKLIAVLPPAYVDTFAIGIDPAATSDRFSIVVWGWSSVHPVGVWQVAEWVTPRAANALKSQWLAVLKLLIEHYSPTVRVIRDAGSASETDDVALVEYGLNIEPAKKGKGSVKFRVDRLADLLGVGRAHVLGNSELERDLQLAALDPEARSQGRHVWTSDCHPDVADAATYALAAYVEAEARETKVKTFEELAEERVRHSWEPKVEYGYGAHEDDTSYGGPTY